MAKFSVTVLFVTFAFLSGRLQSQTLQNDLYVTNGTVLSTAVSGNTLYIGGQFSEVGENSGAFVETDPSTGQFVPRPPVVGYPPGSGNQSVRAAVSDGSGGWYIGGSFTNVGGVATSGLAHIRSDNTVDPNFTPFAQNSVFALALSGSTLYVGGAFSIIGDSSRTCIAAINVSTGKVTSWNPNPGNNGQINALQVFSIVASDSVVYVGGQFTTIGDSTRYCIAALDTARGLATSWNANCPNVITGQQVNAIAVTNSVVYVGGLFTSIGDSTRYDIAALDPSTGLATSWNPEQNGPAGSGEVTALAVSGSVVYAGGTFTFIGGQPRNRIAAIDALTGLATTWNPGGTGANGDVWSIVVSGSSVYAGGSFYTMGDSTRYYAAAIDASTGTVTAWNPDFDLMVWTIVANSSDIFVGGDMTMADTQTRNNIAAFNLTTGAVTSWNPDASSEVLAILPSGPKIYVGGEFSGIGGQTRNSVAALDTLTGAATSWNPNVWGGVNSLAESGSDIYLGGTFTLINGVQRNYIAAVDSLTGLPTAWNPNADSYVYSLVADGPIVYAGGDFFNVGDSTRHRIAALDSSTGLATSWNPNASNDVDVLSQSGSIMYVGGSFTSIGDSARSNIAALNLSSGTATSWNPGASSFVYSLVPASNAVYAGGDFTNVGGQTRNYIAALNPSTGLAESWNPHADYDVRSITLCSQDSIVYFGGPFYSVSGLVRPYLAGATESNSVVPNAPLLFAPASGDTLSDRDIALVWYSSFSASYYELQVAKDSAFKSVVIDTSSVTDTLFVPQTLSSGTKYYWRVRAANGDGTSPFSAAWYFITASPTLSLTIVSVTPSNGSVNVSLKTHLSITFSAPLDTSIHLDNGLPFLMFTNIDSADSVVWSNNLSTLNVVAYLQPNTVYTVGIFQAFGLGGLKMQKPYILRFTTGSQFPPDSVSGTVLDGTTEVSGDSAVVGLTMAPSLGTFGSIPPLVAVTTTDSSGNFVIPDVPNGTYYPVALKDVDRDGIINPLAGKDVFAVGTPVVVNDASVTGVVLTWTSFKPVNWKEGLSITDSLFLSLPAHSQIKFVSGLGVDTSGNSLEWVTGVTNNNAKSGFLVTAGAISTILPMDSTIYDSLSAFTAFSPDTAAGAGLFVGNAMNSGGRTFLQQYVSIGDSVYLLLYLGQLKRTQLGAIVPDSGLYWGAQYVALNPKAIVQTTSISFIGNFKTGAILLATGVKDRTETIPKSYVLYQNYPNPFNPTTKIDYQLPKNSHVTLKVYDILGREVQTLVDANQNAGNYSVSFDGSSLASGVYFYRIMATGSNGQSFVSIKKLALVK